MLAEAAVRLDRHRIAPGVPLHVRDPPIRMAAAEQPVGALQQPCLPAGALDHRRRRPLGRPADLGDRERRPRVVGRGHDPPGELDLAPHQAQARRVRMQGDEVEVALHPRLLVEPAQEPPPRHPAPYGRDAGEHDPCAAIGGPDRSGGDLEQARVLADGRLRVPVEVEVGLVPDLPAGDRRAALGALPEVPARAVAAHQRGQEAAPGRSVRRIVDRRVQLGLCDPRR